ncbi:hypothetical protein V5O48_006583 [Marasmius crinis-equi]|uniref:Uncharacterized protein n=1 Tax=Marasmius crinis-equi TaxID=585013 RepID=A0ABR3FJ42_9AGAR
MAVYDFLQNMFFTFMFCWPLHRSKLMTPALRKVAKKTLMYVLASSAPRVSSDLDVSTAANALVLVGLGGHEQDWVCMTSCVLDITLNAIIIFWVSSGAPSDSVDHFTLPTISQPIETSQTWAARDPKELEPSKADGSLHGVIPELKTLHSIRTHNLEPEVWTKPSSEPILREGDSSCRDWWTYECFTLERTQPLKIEEKSRCKRSHSIP